MKLSLVCATYNRTVELVRLLNSLSEQKYKDFELVIVDQNKKGLLNNLIEKYSTKIDIKHVNTENNGLSRARNIGVKYSCGDVLAFPDDDCWYEYNVLDSVVEYLSTIKSCGLLSVGLYNENTELFRRFYPEKVNINSGNALKIACSSTIFIKKSLFIEVCGFNNRLGLGNIYGSGEETDLLYKVLSLNIEAYYNPEIKIYHKENKFTRSFSSTITYGLGMGVVLRRYIPVKGVWLILRALFGGIAFACICSWHKSRLHFITFFSRFAGYCSYKDVYSSEKEI